MIEVLGGSLDFGNFLISDDKSLLNIDSIQGFLKQNPWAAKRTRDLIIKSIENSLCIGAYLDGEQVGFARVVTDNCTFAYLCDVFVGENHRGQGISKLMLSMILKHENLQGLRRFALVTEDAHGLYEQFGFEEAPPGSYMEIKNENV